MDSIDIVTFNACEDIKCLEKDINIEDEGSLLKVPVFLYNVCPYKKIIVGVSVYVDGKFYAIKTKKMFTGSRSYCSKTRKFYAGEFLFLFTDECNKNVRVRVLAHYID